jgi:hypothetical protein
MPRDSVLLLCVLAIASCSSPAIEPPRITATAAQLHLRASMSDEQIIRALGFDPARMKQHRVQGPDGYGTDYKAPDGRWVGITRSASTGTFVMVWDARGQKGSWELGFK